MAKHREYAAVATTNHRWQVLEERLLLDKRPWLRVKEQTVRLADGRVIDDYLVAEAPSYAIIFPVLPDGRILAVEEYKHGIGRIVLQLPAGLLDPGEDALTGAKRELLEETGYQAGTWQALGSFYDDSNRGMSLGHYFFATNLKQVAEPDAGDLDEVRPIVLTPTALRAAIHAGRVTTASVVASMMLGLEMHSTQQGADHVESHLPQS
ncbi:MAG TPA: NUDIX hydrolase [Caldilineae bacterium]|nr:NUDIX hydrolase [Caldilineae bacterium]